MLHEIAGAAAMWPIPRLCAPRAHHGIMSWAEVREDGGREQVASCRRASAMATAVGRSAGTWLLQGMGRSRWLRGQGRPDGLKEHP